MISPPYLNKLLTTAIVALAALIGGSGRAEPPTLATAITNVSVFDSAKESMVPAQTIVIRNDRIEAVGDAVTIPPGAKVIDGSGQFVIPGLIDAHVHLVHLTDRTHVAGEEYLPMFLGAGVTSVRSTGDLVEAEKRISQYADEHIESCPRVFMASPLIDCDPPTHKDVGLAVTKPEQVPQFVEEMQQAGVTTLKIYVGTSRDIGQLVIAEGHRRGLIVTGHLGRYSAQDAVADGIDCLEHIWSVLDYIVPRGETRTTCNLNNAVALKLIGDIKEKGVAVDPTLVVFRNMILLGDQQEFIEHPDISLVPKRMKVGWQHLLQERQFPPETPELRRKEFRKYQELTGVLYLAGITVLAGTDAPEPLVPPGLSMHQELEVLVESGIPAGAALNCATINNARILKQDKNLGSIEAGKLADLVVLSRNPLDDIRNTRTIAKVVRAGRVLDPAEILQKVPAE
jgi:hypothetical protein